MNDIDIAERLQDLIRVILVPNIERITIDTLICILQGKEEPNLGNFAKAAKEKHLVMKQRFDNMHGKVKIEKSAKQPIEENKDNASDWANWEIDDIESGQIIRDEADEEQGYMSFFCANNPNKAERPRVNVCTTIFTDLFGYFFQR